MDEFKTICNILHVCKYRLVSKHVFSYGTHETIQEYVQGETFSGDACDVGVASAHADGSVLVEEGVVGVDICRHPMVGDYVVLPVLHPVCARCSQEVFRRLFGIKKRLDVRIIFLVIFGSASELNAFLELKMI